MEISPIKQEILEKLYTKAYVTEKTPQSKDLYKQFVDESIGYRFFGYQKIQNEIRRTFFSLWFFSFMSLIWLFSRIDYTVYYAFGVACVISFVGGNLITRKNKKILKFMMPYMVNIAIEKEDEFCTKNDQELRDKYLTEHSEIEKCFHEAEDLKSTQSRVKTRTSKFEHARALKKPSIYVQITNKICHC